MSNKTRSVCEVLIPRSPYIIAQDVSYIYNSIIQFQLMHACVLMLNSIGQNTRENKRDLYFTWVTD
jgi:hypothetical protein